MNGNKRLLGSVIGHTVLMCVVVTMGMMSGCVSDREVVGDGWIEAYRVDLYFGRDMGNEGEVDEDAFERFIDEYVTPHVGGMTIYKAEGRYRLSSGEVIEEGSYVVTVLYRKDEGEVVMDALKKAASDYAERFEQESVLIERKPTTMRFAE
ncbi:DUF3574 domain-containing protein [Planctomycetota bacterium]|nr:DUF3574 domain-containing protein [Planctomycetota bacterium]